MRITFLMAALDMGGGVRVVAQYAEGLRRRGHNVLVVAPPPRPYDLRGKLRNLIHRKVPSRHHHFESTSVAVKVLKQFRPIRASDVPPADVIIATWWETAEWLANFPADRGTPLHFVQDYEIWNGHKARVDATLRLPVQKVTISEWLKAILVDDLGADAPAVVANGVDPDLFFADARTMPAEPTIGFVYAPNPRKGSDLAVEAIANARKIVPNLRCVAFGHGEPTDALPLPDFVEYHMAPPQSQLRDIYGRCSAWLFASREEGFGLPLLESMACGTPVIAAPAGAAPEILASGGGTLLSSHDVGEMTDAIIRYARLDSSEWDRISQEALQISRDHSLERSVASFVDFVESSIETK